MKSTVLFLLAVASLVLPATSEGGPEVVSWQLGFAPEAKH
jgi:hypothetical protein